MRPIPVRRIHNLLKLPHTRSRVHEHLIPLADGRTLYYSGLNLQIGLRSYVYEPELACVRSCPMVYRAPDFFGTYLQFTDYSNVGFPVAEI
jgi:hypothetical protein